MPRIVTISFPDDKIHLLDQVDKLEGSRSGHFVAAMEKYLENVSPEGEAAPPWYIPGKNYSHLPLEAQRRLVPFGYVVQDVP